jgi:hypothetical protein
MESLKKGLLLVENENWLFESIVPSVEDQK